MKYQVIHLKEHFDFLGKDNSNPIVEMYLPYNMTEMHRENQKRPCIIICPGGAYKFNSQREAEPVALNFLSEGFNVFVLTYSCIPHKFPTQMLQVAALMELIYENADKWNCNTSKITIMGFSAGGHLAAQYSNIYDCKEVRKVFPQSKPVNATVLGYPVITADYDFTHRESIENLLGHKPCNDDEQAYFSCECQVDGNTPPAFIWATAADEIVPVKNSLAYAGAMSDNNVPFELHIYPFGGHGLSTSDEQTNDEENDILKYNHSWLNDAKNWLNLMHLN